MREASKQATSCFVFENPKKTRYPFLYECIHTPGCFHARMTPLGECKFAGKTCCVEGSETGVSFVSKTIRLLGTWEPTWQPFALPMDMQTTVQPVVCNEALHLAFWRSLRLARMLLSFLHTDVTRRSCFYSSSSLATFMTLYGRRDRQFE